MRIDKDGFYSQKELDLIIQYHKGYIQLTDVPFNMLPPATRDRHLEKLNAYFPAWCTNCNAVDESDFIVPGVSMCQHCSNLIERVDIDQMPSIESVKLKTLALANRDIDIINQEKKAINFITDSEVLWIQYWRLYLQIRKWA